MLAVLWVIARPAGAQIGGVFGPSSQFDLADTVQLDRADSTVLAQLERVKAYLADHQWDEAVETLQQVMDNTEGKLLAVTERRYVAVGDYCQLQFATLPPPALKLYRSRVDPTARKWYSEGGAPGGIANCWSNVVEQAFASSWGDKALLALGEMALESGDYTAARWYWERILPVEPPAERGQDLARLSRHRSSTLAMVRARLVLVSILEGSAARRGTSWRSWPGCTPRRAGRLGGREVQLRRSPGRAVGRERRVAQARPGEPDWPTFAGCHARQDGPAGVRRGRAVARGAWRMQLLRDPQAGIAARSAPAIRPRCSATSPCCWAAGYSSTTSGRSRPWALPTGGRSGATDADDLSRPAGGRGRRDHGSHRHAGRAAIHHDRLRGPALRPHGQPRHRPPATGDLAVGSGCLVCLDLEAEGGCSGRRPRKRAGPLKARRWSMARASTWPCAAATSAPRPTWPVSTPRPAGSAGGGSSAAPRRPARGMFHQSTHNLLTLARRDALLQHQPGRRGGRFRRRRPDALGQPLSARPARRPAAAGAALAARPDAVPLPSRHAAGGPRRQPDRSSPWTPAPGKCSGRRPELEDAVHLLGVAGDWLIASGRRLYWIGLKDQQRGRLRHVWPEGQDKLGYGRGVLAGRLRPLADAGKIYVFDAEDRASREGHRPGPPGGPRRKPARGRRPAADGHRPRAGRAGTIAAQPTEDEIAHRGH